MTAPQDPRVVTFGEFLLRLSPQDQQRFFESDQWRAGFGGAEANVAVALAHLGVQSDYVTRLPDNVIGDAALDLLKQEGVGTRHVLRGPERMGIYFVEPGANLGVARVVYDRRGSAFASMQPGTVNWASLLDGAAWFHATGITPLLGDGPAALLGDAIATARAHKVPFSFDLNYRPALWQESFRPRIRALITGAELLIANPHAVRPMLGIDADDATFATPDGIRSLAAQLAAEFDCRSVALTRREVLSGSSHAWSATLYHAGTGAISSSSRREVSVVDRIGGGDAFAAALIAQLVRGVCHQPALDFAVVASLLKMSTPGDFNRVTAADVDAFLAP